MWGCGCYACFGPYSEAGAVWYSTRVSFRLAGFAYSVEVVI